MKKIIFLLALVAGLLAFQVQETYSQGTVVDQLTLPADSVKTVHTTLTIYSPLLEEYWDYSIQLKSTFAGLGDSSNWEVKTYQSNYTTSGPWTEITALRDTLQTVTNNSAILIEKTDFQGVWMKHVITSLSLDTVIITPYVVKKQKRNRFF